MLEKINFIKNTKESDDKYIWYNLNKSIRIFNCFIESVDLEDIYIYVSCSIDIESIFDEIISYIAWLSQCETELRTFYENEIHDRVYDNWFNDIEVYGVSITFNNKDDYGATISCGDTIHIDHAMDIDFEKHTIDNIRLNG